jgi:hypothetical protein
MKLALSTSLLGMNCLGTYGGYLDSQYTLNEDSIENDFHEGYIDFNTNYYSSNFDSRLYMETLVKKLDRYLVPEILETLKKQSFGKYISKISMLSYYSPKEYNFSSDSFDIDITCNKLLLKELVKYVRENDVELSKFLHQQYTSCSGFWSFTANNIDDCIEGILKSDVREISSVLRFIIEKDWNETHESFEEKILFMTQIFELYYSEFVNYKSLDETIEQIKSRDLKDYKECGIDSELFNHLVEKYCLHKNLSNVIASSYMLNDIELVNQSLQKTYDVEFDFTDKIKTVFNNIDSTTLNLF